MMLYSRNLRLLTAAVLAVFITATHTPAAEEEPALSPPVTDLEIVTVTAGKRQCLARDFPGSISVRDNAFLEEHQALTTDAMTRFIPNLFYKKALSGDAFVARGISTIDTSLFSPMGLYINDVAYPLSYMQSRFLFDVKRVEVLKGPQSTLYGKNSSSGVINVVLAEPGNEFYGRTLVEAGTYNSLYAGVAAGGPAVKDTLYWGLSASGLDTDGYMENPLTGADDVGDDRHLSARGTLRWTPNEDLSVSFFMDGRDQDTGVADLRFEDGPFATDRFQVVSNGPDRSVQDSLGQALRLNYRGRTADITSITAHQRFNRDMIMDFDRSPVPLGHALVDLTQDSWSQEFRVSGSQTRLDWLGGVYASRETLDNTWALDHVNPAMANRRVSCTTTQSLALFGQSTLALTGRFKATAGLRLDHYRGEGRQAYTRSGTSQIFDKDLSQTQWLPMAALSYALTDRIDGYLTYSTGWLAGGYDYYSATSQDTFTYDPEYTRNYEAGIKARFFNNRLKTNLSVFYTDIEDKQVKEEVPGGGPGIWKFTNAARAHTQGVELEVTALALGNLEIFGGVGYARSQVDDWTGRAGGKSVDYSGKRLPWAPELTANAGIGYYMDNGIYTVADVFWAGRQYFDAANTLEDGGYELVNLKAGYRFKAFDISLWCRNLFDRKYANKKVKNNMGYTQIEDGHPLTLGITFNWRL